MGNTNHIILYGNHPSLLYTWEPSNPIVHMGTIHPCCMHWDHPSLLYMWTIHPYCTHGDHPFQLYTWGPSIPIVHMGDHPCLHGDYPSLLCIWELSIPIVPSILLYTWGPSIPIVYMGVGHRTPVPMWRWWGLYCHIFSLPLLAPLTHHLLMSSLWL